MSRPRSPLKSLLAILEAGVTPLALFDAERRLVFANAAFGARVGKPLDELLGKVVDYHSQENIDGTGLARFSPPPEAFLGERRTFQLDGDRFEFLPLRTADSSTVDGVLAILGAADAHDEIASDDPSAAHHAMIQTYLNAYPHALQSEYLLGNSPAMRRLREQVRTAAATNVRTLLVGSAGYGLRETAITVHVLASRENFEPLVEIQSELHDAESLLEMLIPPERRRGVAPDASPGDAILLHRIEKLSLPAQRELLAVLKTPHGRRRIITTCGTSPSRAIKRERLLPELACELGVFVVKIPPLSARTEDIPLLVQWFIERFNALGGRQLSGADAEAIAKLTVFNYRRGIDELGEIVTTACEQSRGVRLTADDLPERVHGRWDDLTYPATRLEPIELDSFLEQVERELLSRAMTQSRGNKAEAARLLGVSRPRLLRRLEQLGLIVRSEEPIDFQPLNGDDATESAS